MHYILKYFLIIFLLFLFVCFSFGAMQWYAFSKVIVSSSGPPEGIPPDCIFYLDNSVNTQDISNGYYTDASANGSMWTQSVVASRPIFSNISATAGNALYFHGKKTYTNFGPTQAIIEKPNPFTNQAGFVIECIYSATQNVASAAPLYFAQGIGGSPQISIYHLDERMYVTGPDIGNQIMNNQWPTLKLRKWHYYVWVYQPNSSLCYANATNAATPDTSLTVVTKVIGNNKIMIGAPSTEGLGPIRLIAGYTNPAIWTPLYITNRYEKIKSVWPGLNLP